MMDTEYIRCGNCDQIMMRKNKQHKYCTPCSGKVARELSRTRRAEGKDKK